MTPAAATSAGHPSLHADVTEGWPPPLNDESSQRWTLRFAEDHPEAAGWGSWYLLLARDAAPPLAIGIAGFRGGPGPDGSVEIGYSVMERHQQRGYGGEAARAEHRFLHGACVSTNWENPDRTGSRAPAPYASGPRAARGTRAEATRAHVAGCGDGR